MHLINLINKLLYDNLRVKSVEIGINEILSNSNCPEHIVSQNHTRTINTLIFIHNTLDLHRLEKNT